MKASFFFLFPAFFVEFGEAFEDFDAGGFGNRVADIVVRRKIAYLMEAMSKVYILPTIRITNSNINLTL